jgi:hypothetical protein
VNVGVVAGEPRIARYLELALRLGKHDEDLVDSFYGSDQLAQQVEAECPLDPAALAEDAEALLADLGDDPWLAAQVRALWANARKLAGERFEYAEEGRLVYGIEPLWHDEQAFRRAAGLLDEALPGTGDLRARYAAWLERIAIPRELLEQALLDVAAELRRLTRERIGLPDGEEFELELVTGERWLGYAEYLGKLRTKISINTDLPLPAANLVHLTSHEIYGGHHTHRAWIEAELVPGRGRADARPPLGAGGRDLGGHRRNGPGARRRGRAGACRRGARPPRARARRRGRVTGRRGA